MNSTDLLGQYKTMDISLEGQLELSEEITTDQNTDKYYRVHPIHNSSQKIEIFQNNQLIEYKILIYDESQKIINNTLYRDNQLVDTWHYSYHPQTGTRTKKTIIDNHGQIIKETSYQ